MEDFIKQARHKGLSDEKITELLKSNGWTDDQIQGGLYGLSVPKAPGAPHVPTPPAGTPQPPKTLSPAAGVGRPTISALSASLQHVLLWLFTATSSVMFGVAAGVLYDMNTNGVSDFGRFLTIFLVVELVSFIPFAVFYFVYLRSQRKEPELQTGRVWSIITVVLHSIGLVSATIAFILILCFVRNEAVGPSALYAGGLLVMNLLVVVAYVVANFSPTTLKGRRWILWALPVGSLVLIIGFTVALIVGNAQRGSDAGIRADLVSATESVREYANDHNRLPDNLKQAGYSEGNLTYSKDSSYAYQLCAEFSRSAQGASAYTSYDNQSDSYINESTFYNDRSGRQCFTLYNPELRSFRTDSLDRYDDQTLTN